MTANTIASGRTVTGRIAAGAWRSAASACAVLWLLASAGTSAAATQETPPEAASTALLAEVRHSFTVRGRPIPPEIFRDFGDGDLADAVDGIWVTVDVDAATGSNLYYDEIKSKTGYVSQKKTGGDEETGYRFIGTTQNGLLAVLADYSSGGSGDFVTLHILDIAAVPSYDYEGKVRRRALLTNLRSVVLGDRWDGDVNIAGNTIRIVTRRNGPADEKPRAPMTIEAKRP